MDTIENTDSTKNADHATMAYKMPLEQQLVNALAGFEFGLGEIASGAEALSGLGETIDANGHEYGAGVVYTAGKLEIDIMNKQSAFEKLRELIYAVAPGVKSESDRQQESFNEACGIEAK